jgi:uncharacterized protein (DUF2236 family)
MTISKLGLFGPESVTWRLHADPLLAVGALRALLLQALHPVAMAAVAEHSGFREDPWGRIRRTAEYIGVTTYGTTDEAARVAARVRGIHRPLTARDPETGELHRVDEPALLLWVHCCEVDSFLTTLRRGGVRISDRDADRYVAEQVRAARLVGIDPDEIEVPQNVAGLAGYFERVRPQLHATAAAYEGARFVLSPPMRWWVRLATPAVPSWAALASLSFCLLPRWARSLYSHLPAIPTTDAGATASLRALRVALLAVPAPLREGPHLKAGRTRVARIPIRRLDALGIPRDFEGYRGAPATTTAPDQQATGA